MSVGDNIKKLRKERGLTQEAMASMIGISRNYLSELENDKRGLSQVTLDQLSKSLQVTVNYLIYGSLEISKIEFCEEKFIASFYFKSGEKIVARITPTDSVRNTFGSSKILGLVVHLDFYPDKAAVINRAPNFTHNGKEPELIHFILDKSKRMVVNYYIDHPDNLRVRNLNSIIEVRSLDYYGSPDEPFFVETRTSDESILTFGLGNYGERFTEYEIVSHC